MIMRYPIDALTAAANQCVPRVLVTVCHVAGDAPREPGAKMLVTQYQTFDSIGGGALEFRATTVARTMLAMPAGATGAERRIERMTIESDCGEFATALVDLAFERIDAPALQALRVLRRRARGQQDAWRLSAFDSDAAPSVYDEEGKRLCGGGPAQLLLPGPGINCKLRVDPAGARWLVDAIASPRPHLVLFGAGHIGAAVVRALAGLPCRVSWIDERDHLFPPLLPSHIRVETGEPPEMIALRMPAGACYLIATHSDALDQRLAEALLRRGDAQWVGLIGSRTRRAQFERRLRQRGVTAERLAALTCPVGIAGVDDPHPAVIAASVVAQLLQVWEQAANALPQVRYGT